MGLRANRLRRYKVSAHFLLCFSEGDVIRVNKAIPAGAKLHEATYEAETSTFVLIVEHESFDQTSPSSVIPYGDSVEFTMLDKRLWPTGESS